MEHYSVVLTVDCNLRCRYCWYTSGQFTYVRTVLTSSDFDRWLDACRQVVTPRALTFTGGEPMLRGDLPEWLEVGRQHGLDLGLLTNGTLMTQEWARRLRDLDVEVHVTLDSLTPDYHNSVRGEHEKVMRAIHFLAQADVRRRFITTVVTRGNIDQLDDILDFALSQGFRLNLHPCALPAEDPLSIVSCTTREKAQLYRALLRWVEHSGNIRMVGQVSSLTHYGRTIKLSRCLFAERSLVIDADGTIYPCYKHRKEPLGNILADAPSEVQARWKAFCKRIRPGACIEVDCLGVL